MNVACLRMKGFVMTCGGEVGPKCRCGRGGELVSYLMKIDNKNLQKTTQGAKAEQKHRK